MQPQALQGWEVHPLMLRHSRPYIDDLQCARKRLRAQASLVFVNDPNKIALEILSHCDNGDSTLPFIDTDWTNVDQMVCLFTDVSSRRSLAYGRNWRYSTAYSQRQLLG